MFAPEYYTALKKERQGPRAAPSVHKGRTKLLQGVRRVRSSARCWAAPMDSSTTAAAGNSGHGLGAQLVLARPGCVSGRVTYAIWAPGFHLQTGLDSQGCCEDARRQYLGVLSPTLGRNAHVSVSSSPSGGSDRITAPILPAALGPTTPWLWPSGQNELHESRGLEACVCISASSLGPRQPSLPTAQLTTHVSEPGPYQQKRSADFYPHGEQLTGVVSSH